VVSIQFLFELFKQFITYHRNQKLDLHTKKKLLLMELKQNTSILELTHASRSTLNENFELLSALKFEVLQSVITDIRFLDKMNKMESEESGGEGTFDPQSWDTERCLVYLYTRVFPLVSMLREESTRKVLEKRKDIRWQLRLDRTSQVHRALITKLNYGRE
jgi:hypothetical protein